MLIVAAFIRKMSANTSCRQFCLGVTHAIRSRYRKDCLDHLALHPEDRLCASAVVYSRLRRELWMIGDCQALLVPLQEKNTAIGAEMNAGNAGNAAHADGEADILFLDNPKPYEQELARERADIILSSPEYRQWLTVGGQPPQKLYEIADAARAAIIPHMLRSMQQQNVTYSVFDGFPVAQRHVRVITLDFQPHQLVLASDGYPFLFPSLAESEARLEKQHRQDPLCIGPDFMATKGFTPGFNSFDDRAYIRFFI